MSALYLVPYPKLDLPCSTRSEAIVTDVQNFAAEMASVVDAVGHPSSFVGLVLSGPFIDRVDSRRLRQAMVNALNAARGRSSEVRCFLHNTKHSKSALFREHVISRAELDVPIEVREMKIAVDGLPDAMLIQTSPTGCGVVVQYAPTAQRLAQSVLRLVGPANDPVLVERQTAFNDWWRSTERQWTSSPDHHVRDAAIRRDRER